MGKKEKCRLQYVFVNERNRRGGQEKNPQLQLKMTSTAPKAYNNKIKRAFSFKMNNVKFRKWLSHLQNTFRKWS